MEAFLAKVVKVYLTSEDFLPLEKKIDDVIVYNDNKKFDSKNARFIGAIDFEKNITEIGYAFPFDKNNMTYPITGETVMVIKNENEYLWLPYTAASQYPNYREDFKTSFNQQGIGIEKSSAKSGDYQQSQNAPQSSQPQSNSNKYKVKEYIKFVKPKPGDTILQGRVGNTIRFSESFLVSEKTPSEPSPSIIISNFQNPEVKDKNIGELIEEDINKDGSSIYIVSKNCKVPYKHTTIEKTKVGFKGYPSDFKGNQIFVNSDRILLSAKVSEFIIFGKGNTGIITDGNFSVDAKKEFYLHSEQNQMYQCEKNITIHSKGSNKIFLNSDSGGKIYLGKDSGAGDAGADVQKMVLGGELVKILGEILDAINQQVYLTPCGPSSPGPTNAAQFSSIKSKLKTLLSARNFLSKS